MLTLVETRLSGSRFTGNLLLHLLAVRNVVVGTLLWSGITRLLAIANMDIAYPAVLTWARREALAFCLLITFAFGSNIWTAAHLLAR